MRVRMTQQVQGTRAGQAWPEPGTEVDLPDDEARLLISGGAAVDPADAGKTVLVPPMGVHTPGRVAMPTDATSPLVEAPADAAADPDKARAAYLAAREGDFVQGPAGIAHQKATGLAHDQESLDKAGDDERRTRESLAGTSPKAGEESRATKAGPGKAK